MSTSDVVIRVEGLGKKYSLHHEQSERYMALRDVVARQAKAAGRLLNPFTLAGQMRKAQHQAALEQASSEEEFWALKDVSFQIRRGERVGIIGRNGAGKSTLLKILSRITEPTTGRVEIRGRVASLLEVGTGFHPELTGRENIYLNGAILGMTRREIHSKFDEIVDFAEVEKFLDTPVKRYSSGMYVRLAFAVAAHLEPEILVVDEVLAVGDASFQKKCIGKMQDASSSDSRTILFVSHNMDPLRNLCNIGIVLSQGTIQHTGSIASAVDTYQGSVERSINMYKRDWTEDIGPPPGDETLSLISAKAEQDTSTIPFNDNSNIKITLLVSCKEVSPSHKSVSIVITSISGETVLHADSLVCGNNSNLDYGLNTIIYNLPALIFKPGKYILDAYGTEPMVCWHFCQRDILSFEVQTENKELLRHKKTAWLSSVSPLLCSVNVVNHGCDM